MGPAWLGSRMKGLRSVIEAIGWFFQLGNSIGTEDGRLKLQLITIIMVFLYIAVNRMLQFGTLKIHLRNLKYTEEEAERSFEDFYEDVHTEFLKFGEIVNFKVCRNGSPHLRGNVYVHYKSLESAVLAYQSINGRYFAGKQLTCEFVNLTRWRVAICGEYIKSRLKTCSRGSACNFIHCFRNPGGDYEWADWDKPAPRYWLNSMAALFGCSSDKVTDEVSPSSYHSRKSRSRGLGSSHRKSFSNEDDVHKRRSLWRHSEDNREDNSLAEEMQRRKNTHQGYHCIKHRETGGTDDKRSSVGIKRSMEKRRESDPTKQDRKSGKDDASSAKNEFIERGVSDRYHDHKSKSSSRQKRKGDKFDLGEDTFAGKYRDILHKQKGKKFSQDTKEADSSNIDSHCNSTDSEEDKHHNNSEKNLSRIKCEPDLSSSASDESRLGRVEESKQMNRRNSPRYNRKRSVAETGSDEVSSECDEDGQYKHIEKSLRWVKDNSETFEGGGRIGREEKRPRKSSRLNHQSATETESEKDEAKLHRHSKKHSRRSKKYAHSPDSAFEEDRHGRYRNRPQKSRRMSSRSHNESDFADLDRNGERIVVRRHGHRSIAKHRIKEPSLSKVGPYALSQARDGDKSLKKREANASNFDIDVQCRSSHGNLDRDHPQQENLDRYCGASGQTAKSYIMKTDVQEGILGEVGDSKDVDLVNDRGLKSDDRGLKSDDEATVSSGEAGVELEKACRYAALKKLEEMKKHKNTQAACNSETVEGLRIGADENIVADGVNVNRVSEDSGSIELETSVASVKRGRI